MLIIAGPGPSSIPCVSSPRGPMITCAKGGGLPLTAPVRRRKARVLVASPSGDAVREAREARLLSDLLAAGRAKPIPRRAHELRADRAAERARAPHCGWTRRWCPHAILEDVRRVAVAGARAEAAAGRCRAGARLSGRRVRARAGRSWVPGWVHARTQVEAVRLLAAGTPEAVGRRGRSLALALPAEHGVAGLHNDGPSCERHLPGREAPDRSYKNITLMLLHPGGRQTNPRSASTEVVYGSGSPQGGCKDSGEGALARAVSAASAPAVGGCSMSSSPPRRTRSRSSSRPSVSSANSRPSLICAKRAISARSSPAKVTARP